MVQLSNKPGPTWHLQDVQWKLLVIVFSLHIPRHSQLLGFKHFLMPLLLMLTSSDQWSHPAFSAYCGEINNHAWESKKEVDISISLVLTVRKKKKKNWNMVVSFEEEKHITVAVYLATFTLAQETIFYCSPAFLLVSIVLFFFIVSSYLLPKSLQFMLRMKCIIQQVTCFIEITLVCKTTQSTTVGKRRIIQDFFLHANFRFLMMLQVSDPVQLCG